MLLSYDIWVTPALSRSKAKHSRKLEAVTFKNKRPSDVNLQPNLRTNDIGYNPSHPGAKHCMQSQYTGLERRSRSVFAKQLKHPVAEPILAY